MCVIMRRPRRLLRGRKDANNRIEESSLGNRVEDFPVQYCVPAVKDLS